MASVAAAQRPVEYHDGAVWDAYQNFRSNEILKFDMQGSDRTGTLTTPVHVVMYFRRSMDPRTGHQSMAEAEVDIYTATTTGEVLTMRIVGDGKTLYRYDLVRKEVTSTTYGFYGNIPPANYVGSDVPKLFSQLRAQTPGSSLYAVRLLAEMNPAGIDFAPRFTDWLATPPVADRPYFKASFDEVPIPIRQVAGVDAASTVTDPITGRVFIKGDTNALQHVFYGNDVVNTTRTVSFHLFDADGDPENGSELWEIKTVNIGLRTGNRVLDLEITPDIVNPLAPGYAAGTFEPYSGAFGASFKPISRGQ